MSLSDVRPKGVKAGAADQERPIFVMEATRGWASLNLHDLWDYRELLYFLIWRDIKVRYKQTMLGAAWAIVQPLATMLIFAVIFGWLAQIPSDDVPYPIFTFVGLLPWQFFTLALNRAATSLVNNGNLISKVYFPRMLVPISGVLAGLIDFVLAFIVFLGMMVFYRVTPTPAILLLPAFTLLAMLAALGVGLWLSALNVEYRDVGQMMPFLTQIWMYATPIVYPSSLLPEPWRTLYGLNPMAGVIEGFRWALLGTTPPWPMIAVSASVTVVLFVSGMFYFRRLERKFVDII